jgi:hypothetical protein
MLLKIDNKENTDLMAEGVLKTPKSGFNRTFSKNKKKVAVINKRSVTIDLSK